jgi:iron complex transport system permease protein
MIASRRFVRAVLILTATLLIAVVLALTFGSELLDPRALFTGEGDDSFILFSVRLPRVLVAACIGAILAAAGATFQTLLRNTLADPFILGVSGGAACAAALATALGLASRPGAVEGSAFFGAALATAGVFLLARRGGEVDSTRLIMSGLVLNSFFSAVILISLSSTRGTDLSAALRWMMGSLSAAGWRDAIALGIVLLVVAVALQSLAGDLRLFVFGEEDARSRGVAVERLKLTAFLVASLATGAAVAVGGIIGFVGLLVPYWVRSLFHLDYRGSLPLSMLGGATLLVLADGAARTLAAPAELPVGALLALLGVPFFVVILRKR